MRITYRLWFILAAFFVLAGTTYLVWNFVYEAQDLATDPSGTQRTAPVEWTGTIALYLTAICSLLIGFFLRRSYAGQGGQLPEDRDDAQIDDADGEIGFFSPWSWWPFVMGIGLALVFTGIAIGPWIAFVGAPIAIISIVGLVFEYYRGLFAH
jgi:hypothetical protein